MSDPTITPLPSTASDRDRLIKNVALGAVIVCPIIIMLPPRKLDVYTMALMTATLVGANQVTYEYTGRSLLQRERAWMEALSPGELPAAAKETQRRLAEERAARLVAKNGPFQTENEADNKGVLAELERRRVEKEGKEKKQGILEKVWMGGEDKDWKAKRDQKEKEALEQGKGYGDLIMDQIWEVWNWGKNEAEEIKEEDERVLAQRKHEEENR